MKRYYLIISKVYRFDGKTLYHSKLGWTQDGRKATRYDTYAKANGKVKKFKAVGIPCGTKKIEKK